MTSLTEDNNTNGKNLLLELGINCIHSCCCLLVYMEEKDSNMAVSTDSRYRFCNSVFQKLKKIFIVLFLVLVTTVLTKSPPPFWRAAHPVQEFFNGIILIFWCSISYLYFGDLIYTLINTPSLRMLVPVIVGINSYFNFQSQENFSFTNLFNIVLNIITSACFESHPLLQTFNVILRIWIRPCFVPKNYKNIPRSHIILSCLFPNNALHFGLHQMSSFKAREGGMQWNNILQAANEETNDISLGVIFFISTIGILLFKLLTIMCKKFKPENCGIDGEKGVTKWKINKTFKCIVTTVSKMSANTNTTLDIFLVLYNVTKSQLNSFDYTTNTTNVVKQVVDTKDLWLFLFTFGTMNFMNTFTKSNFDDEVQKMAKNICIYWAKIIISDLGKCLLKFIILLFLMAIRIWTDFDVKHFTSSDLEALAIIFACSVMTSLPFTYFVSYRRATVKGFFLFLLVGFVTGIILPKIIITVESYYGDNLVLIQTITYALTLIFPYFGQGYLIVKFSDKHIKIYICRTNKECSEYQNYFSSEIQGILFIMCISGILYFLVFYLRCRRIILKEEKKIL